MRWRDLYIGLFALLIVGAPPCSADDQGLRIGALLHLSGDLAMQGQAFREGIELAVESANAGGGVRGKPVTVNFEDTRLDPATSHSAALKLLEVNQINAAVVSTASEAKAIGELFEQRKIPVICLWDSSPELDAIGQFVFGIGTWSPSTGEKAAAFSLESLKAKRAAVITNVDEWSISVGETFEKEFRNQGGEIVFRASLAKTDLDFRTLFVRLKKANAEVLYAPIGFNQVAFFKQLRDMRFTQPVIESDNLNEEIITAAGTAVEGIYQTQSSDPESEAANQLAQAYQKRFSRPLRLPLYTAWGFDAVRLLVEGAKIAGPKPSDIANALYGLPRFSGASGMIHFDAAGSSRVLVKMFRVKNGLLRPLEFSSEGKN